MGIKVLPSIGEEYTLLIILCKTKRHYLSLAQSTKTVINEIILCFETPALDIYEASIWQIVISNSQQFIIVVWAYFSIDVATRIREARLTLCIFFYVS